jgi:hypothetical protein
MSRTLFHEVVERLEGNDKTDIKFMPIIYLIVQFAWSKIGKSLINQRGDPITGLMFEPEISEIQV